MKFPVKMVPFAGDIRSISGGVIGLISLNSKNHNMMFLWQEKRFISLSFFFCNEDLYFFLAFLFKASTARQFHLRNWIFVVNE